jgi:GT2 family glycosyltransferase
MSLPADLESSTLAAPLDLSVIVLSFRRPRQLELCLASLAAQRGVEDRFEVIVADDGSTDETAAVVAKHARNAKHPVRLLTHEHHGIHRAYCRNEGIRAASAPYLLFIDDDCILPADHLARHLAARTPGMAQAGDAFRFSERTSEQIDLASVRSGDFARLIEPKMRRALRKMRFTAALHGMLHRSLPKPSGCDFAVWRADLLRVNGFDERYPRNLDEISEVASRLAQVGVRVGSVLGVTHSYRVCSPSRPIAPAPMVLAGVVMGQPSLVLPRCLEGIESRSYADLTVHVIAEPYEAGIARQIKQCFRGKAPEPDIEVLLCPAAGRFTARGARRIVVVQNSAHVPLALRWSADEVIDMNGPRRAAAITAVLQRQLGIDARQAAAA